MSWVVTFVLTGRWMASEKPDLSVANFPRSHERGPVEMRQKIVEAHIGVHFGAALQRRRRRHVDTRHPQIGRHKELISAGGGHLLCGGGVEHSRKCSNAPEYREKEPLRLMHSRFSVDTYRGIERSV